MVDFPFARCSKRCQVQNRPLLPGERYYSVAIPTNASPNAHVSDDHDDADGVYRYDVSASAWAGPPENAIGWWANEMPRAEQARIRPAKPVELLDRLSALCDDPSESALASLFATLLVRRRILVPNPIHESDVGSNAADACPEGFAEYFHRATNSQFRVPSIEPADEDQQALHLRLQQLLVVEVDGSSTEPDVGSTEPMALASGDDSTTIGPIAPEASDYGSEKLDAGP